MSPLLIAQEAVY